MSRKNYVVSKIEMREYFNHHPGNNLLQILGISETIGRCQNCHQVDSFSNLLWRKKGWCHVDC